MGQDGSHLYTSPDAGSDEPLPVAAVRDLLGVARVLHATKEAEGAPLKDLQRLEGAYQDLQRAIALGRTSEPGTFVHKMAWRHAEVGARIVADVVGDDMRARALVEAGVRRVRRR